MLSTTLLWGAVAGIIHFVIISFLYANPFVRGLYSRAAESEPSVRRWPSRPRYLVTQFIGTQVEVYLLTLAFIWLRGLLPDMSLATALAVGLMLAAIRVFPRFWNMWIQTTYPRRLLAVELFNGTLGTLIVVGVLQRYA
jgi:hypothetical protein